MTRNVIRVVLAMALVAGVSYLVYSNPRPARAVAVDDVPAVPIPPPIAPVKPASTEKYDPCQHVYQLVCGRDKVVQDPTGVVEPDVAGEVEALRVYEEIIHLHPGWTSDQVDEELVSKIYTEKRRRRLIEVYNWTLRDMEKFIDRQPASVFSGRSKNQLKYRLRSVRLELPPPASLYAGELDLFTKNDVYYATLANGRRVIRVGGAYLLTAKSWFNRVFTFAHELAHSIDPCDVEVATLKIPIYDRLIGCFKKNNLLKRPAPKCGLNDQRAEIFADWVAVQIAADALDQYKPKFKTPSEQLNSVINAVKDLCHQESWLEDDTQYHPDPRTRIEVIFGRSPQIRQYLGCIPSPQATPYCTFEGETR